MLGLLAAMVVWPMVHHGLARACDISPWSFFGWAMYTVPNLKLNVRAAGLDGEAVDWNAVSPASWGELRAFAERRERYGCLVSPDPLAEDILARQPELPGLLVEVRRFAIDPETARLVPRVQRYRYLNPPR